jgi:hypothetical protein
MAIVQKSEDAIVETVGLLLLLGIGAIALVSYMAAKDVSLPVGIYPDSIWSKFASWIDGLFFDTANFPGKENMRNSTDSWLSKSYLWIIDNLPQSAKSKGYQQYLDTHPVEGESEAEIQGDGTGTGAEDGFYYAGQSLGDVAASIFAQPMDGGS